MAARRVTRGVRRPEGPTALPDFRPAPSLPWSTLPAPDHVPASRPAVPRPAAVHRTRLDDARRDRLWFAQVREDPRLELDVLRPRPAGTYVVVGSGGCTVLSLLAAGAGHVVAVDLNPTQNDLLELKHAAAVHLGSQGALRFLGGAPPRGDRRATYRRIRHALTLDAREWWDGHEGEICRGVLGAGVTEGLVRLFVRLLRLAVHRRATLEELLALDGLEAQERFFRDRWDTWRWRILVRLLLSRGSLTRTYGPDVFRGVGERDFASTFAEGIEHGLCRLPVGDNYFLHHMLTGRYPAHRPESLPPWLQPAGAEGLRSGGGRLEIVDGGVTTWLERSPRGSVDGFALSNVAEWLDPAEVDHLFGEVVRTAAPGARLCFRNFVGWTEVPAPWRSRVVEDRARGEALILRDRSLVQRRFAPCVVRGRTTPAGRTASVLPAPRSGLGDAPTRGVPLPLLPGPGDPSVPVRDARPDDDEALRALAAACPMRGHVEICSEREPSFFTLVELEGESSRVAVAPDGDDRPRGCITVAHRRCRVNGSATRIAHVGDLKVHPSFRDGAMADALSRWARDRVRREAGEDATILVTVLAGNGAMERRLPGSAALPTFTRVGTVRAWSVPVLGRRRPGASGGGAVVPATLDDLEEMAATWGRVAPLRHFTPRLDADTLARWIREAPGVEPRSYLLARDARGRLAGFLGLWDQRSFKQLRVVRYAPRMRLFRRAFNTLGPLMGAPRLPPAGSLVDSLATVHPCVPPDRPAVLRSLLLAARRRAREGGHAFFTVGLDAEDPLAPAFRGLLAQTTDIHVYVTSPRGEYAGPALDGRPLHYETALV